MSKTRRRYKSDYKAKVALEASKERQTISELAGFLDIKPYFPMERVKKCDVPDWFKHWPEWSEDAMSFNWKNEINFG